MANTPLQGVRIADFTWAWAGPYGTMQLGLMGAEIIKIESKQRPDHSRIRSLSAGKSTKGLNQSTIFNEINLNKKSASLNLAKPKAVDLAKKIVAVSDVVVNNFRPGVMDKLGLGYDTLKEIKPDIIMLSSSAVGSVGPEKRYIGYAPTFSALSGIANLTGNPEGPPIPLMGSSDMRSATTTTFALLIALYHKANTGEGQHIELSSSEAMSVLIGDALIDYTMNGKIPFRKGNQDEVMAPHNCYRCIDKDSWISIAVATPSEWEGLCETMENPLWTKEKKFSDALKRSENQKEMDKLIEKWTIKYTSYEVMEKLQKAGVAAIPSFKGDELHLDPHLRARGFTETVNHPELGERSVIGPPWKMSETPARITSPGPLLGEHNDYVFYDLLGMPKDKIQKLKDENIIY